MYKILVLKHLAALHTISLALCFANVEAYPCSKHVLRMAVFMIILLLQEV